MTCTAPSVGTLVPAAQFKFKLELDSTKAEPQAWRVGLGCGTKVLRGLQPGLREALVKLPASKEFVRVMRREGPAFGGSCRGQPGHDLASLIRLCITWHHFYVVSSSSADVQSNRLRAVPPGNSPTQCDSEVLHGAWPTVITLPLNVTSKRGGF